MIVKTIQFNSVTISSFGRDELLLKIAFNDGTKNDVLEKRTELSDVHAFTEAIIAEVRNKAKASSSSKGSGFLGDVVVVNFADDEERLYERLFTTFSRVRDEVRKMRTTRVAQNYLQNLSNIQGATFNF